MDISFSLPTHFFFSGDNGPYTESPQDFHATEPEDIGQDIIFIPSQVEKELSMSEVMAKGGEEVVHTQTATPVKQGPMEAQSPTLGHEQEPPLEEGLQHSTTPQSESLEHSSTVDTLDLIERASYPESYQPAPEENPHIDHEQDQESHLLLTASPDAGNQETVDEESISSTSDGAMSAGVENSEHHPSATDSLNTAGLNAASATEASELPSSSPEVPRESDLPVVQEDPTPDAPLEHVSEADLVHSRTSHDAAVQVEEASTSSDEETSALTASPDTEEPDVPTPPPAPVDDSGHSEDSGEESASQPLDKDTQSAVTEHVDGLDATSVRELVPTSDSGASEASVGNVGT